MMSMYYIGLDIHKKIIAFCTKTANGDLVESGTIPATRCALSEWIAGLPQPWIAAMEATLFTGWVYDFLKPHAIAVKVAHPEMLKAITAAKKKNDRKDAEKICDLLRVDLLPECYMAPLELRELRRMLRYRNHICRTAVKEKIKYRVCSWKLAQRIIKRNCTVKNIFLSFWIASNMSRNQC
jgi:transposase